jgi:hypothetical protein
MLSIHGVSQSLSDVKVVHHQLHDDMPPSVVRRLEGYLPFPWLGLLGFTKKQVLLLPEYLRGLFENLAKSPSVFVEDYECLLVR